MKTLLFAMAAAALMAGPALAQEHEHPPADKPMGMDAMTPEQMHEHCKAMMGGKMQGHPRHDHTADKMGHAPHAKPPTEAEMKAMHERCAAKMADEKKPEEPPAKK